MTDTLTVDPPTGLASAPRIGVVSSKGGVGKTTTVAALAADLARTHNVLAVDLDPQGDLSLSLGFSAENLAASQTSSAPIYAALNNEPTPKFSDVAIPIDEYGTDAGTLFLAPANRSLARVVKLLEADNYGILAVKKAFDSDPHLDIDVVLIDAPPTISTFVVAILAALDAVIVPITPDVRSFRGAERVFEEMGKLAEVGYNPGLECLGVFLAQADSVTNLSSEASDHIASYSSRVPVLAPVPRSVRVSEAAAAGKPITRFASTHQSALAYTEIADSVRRYTTTFESERSSS